MQRIDLGVHLAQFALGLLQVADAVLELGDARGFLLDHLLHHRQVGGAFLNAVAHHFEELLTGAGDLLAGQQHRLAAGLEHREVIHVAADLSGQRLAHLPDLAIFERDVVHRSGEGEREGVVVKLVGVGSGQAGFQVIEPALALQQAIAIQVECLLFGVDRVEAKGDFLFRIGRTDAFQQAQPLAFQTIEADLILMLLGLVERLRQLDWPPKL